MAYSDHIYVTRVGYTHHGIDCGDGTVIHYDGGLWNHRHAQVTRTLFDDFADGNEIQTVEYRRSLPPAMVVQRALDRLGENNYDLFENNCEHFARWCKTGTAKSEQVENTFSLAKGLTHGMMAVAAGIRLAGKGAMTEAMTVGAIPLLTAQLTMEQVLKDDDNLSQEERDARAVGRTMTSVGAVAGTVGTLGVISASGSVAGLSAAGIEAGLTAIGSTVGGGIATGTVLTAAVPALIAITAGYGTYRLWKKWSSKK
jgi:hypothetical protein